LVGVRLLIVLAHPLWDSFTAAVAATARERLVAGGHEVDWLDLYQEDFDPRLTEAERATYYADRYDGSAVAALVARLTAADGIVLVFPQWWFGFPAILKGFFDRVFAPGVAFAHGKAGGILPRLTNIRLFYALTTTGSPWWVVRLAMGDPVRRVLKRGLASMCAKDVRFHMLSLHDMDRANDEKRLIHLERVRRLMAEI
jgi:putative NADPH-quinone reductase